MNRAFSECYYFYILTRGKLSYLQNQSVYFFLKHPVYWAIFKESLSGKLICEEISLKCQGGKSLLHWNLNLLTQILWMLTGKCGKLCSFWFRLYSLDSSCSIFWATSTLELILVHVSANGAVPLLIWKDEHFSGCFVFVCTSREQFQASKFWSKFGYWHSKYPRSVQRLHCQ